MGFLLWGLWVRPFCTVCAVCLTLVFLRALSHDKQYWNTCSCHVLRAQTQTGFDSHSCSLLLSYFMLSACTKLVLFFVPSQRWVHLSFCTAILTTLPSLAWLKIHTHLIQLSPCPNLFSLLSVSPSVTHLHSALRMGLAECFQKENPLLLQWAGLYVACKMHKIILAVHSVQVRPQQKLCGQSQFT